MTSRLFVRHRVSCSFLFVALICFLAFSAGMVQAGDIGLTKPLGSPPDIFTSYDSTSYDAITHRLTAYTSSYAAVLNDAPNPGDSHYILLGDGGNINDHVFTIDMLINPDTGVPQSGTLNITGRFDDNYLGVSTDQTLLTGTINKLGFFGAGPTGELQFVFDVTGGALQSSSVFPASQVGILMHESQFAGDWHTSFSTGAALSDTFSVPEPASWVFLSTLLLGGSIVLRRRRRA